MNEKSKKIHRFFKRNCYENLLFGWVTSIRYFLPGVTIPKAIDQFFKYYEVDENEFSKNNAKVIVNRMTKEYFDNGKTTGEIINNQ